MDRFSSQVAPLPAGKPCPFCEIVAGRAKAEIVAEDGETLAFLDHSPLLIGRVLLPRVLRMGAALEPRTGTLVSAAFQDNLNTTTVGGVWDRSLGLGVQQRIAFVSARVGLSSNLESGTLLSGGLSLGPIHLGVAKVSDSRDGADSSGWIATFGLATASRTTMP